MYTPILKALGLQILIDIWRLFVTYNELKKQKYSLWTCDRIRRCGQKVGLDILKREIERYIQNNNITKLSRSSRGLRRNEISNKNHNGFRISSTQADFV